MYVFKSELLVKVENIQILTKTMRLPINLGIQIFKLQELWSLYIQFLIWLKMGILKLMDFLKTKFPQVIKQRSIGDYSGKILALDASNWTYQFLIKTQTLRLGSNVVNVPTDPFGNQTGHLIGMLSRIAFCLENDIKTVWVYDGKPPDAKKQQLKRRRAIKKQAQQQAQRLSDIGQTFDLLKLSKRSVRFSQQQILDAKKLIQLIGLPVITSASQAQSQCSQLVKSGLCHGTISEDTDTLTFGCPRMIRYLHADIREIQLQEILEAMKFTYEQFVDFCILCGCDYTTRIKNIGPVKAYDFIKKYNNIDNLLKQIAKDQKLFNRHEVDDDFNHLKARTLFTCPNINKITQKELQQKFTKFKQEQIIQFLTEKQFNQTRITNWLERIRKTNYYKGVI